MILCLERDMIICNGIDVSKCFGAMPLIILLVYQFTQKIITLQGVTVLIHGL